MARRHTSRPGDWESIALRLDEIISAHSGEDPFEESLKLLVAALAHEASGAAGDFLAGCKHATAAGAVDRLLGSAASRWPGIVEPDALTRLHGPELSRCAAALAGSRLFADDLVGLDAIVECIVARASRGQKGQFFTPRYVIAEVIAMLRPAPGERVADPACGSGGFLRHALRSAPGCSVWGFDLDPRASRVARVMMVASGQPPTCVARCDSLRRPPGAGDDAIEARMRAHDAGFAGFDVIATNPPFAGDVGAEYAGAYALARGRRVERDVLFIERCVELLRPGGRLAMVLPHNKVGGEPWGYARKWLMERVRVVGVVGLGRNTFRPHTSQKACVVLGVKRARPVASFADDAIEFFVSDRDGKDPRGRVRYDASGAVDHDLAEATARMRAGVARAVEEG